MSDNNLGRVIRDMMPIIAVGITAAIFTNFVITELESIFDLTCCTLSGR